MSTLEFCLRMILGAGLVMVGMALGAWIARRR